MILRREEGQIIPALVMVMLTLVAFGMLFFQVGRASIFWTEAQTAADAAALAAVKDVRAQLMEQVALTGTSDLALINPLRVRAAAESYAQRNKAHVVRLDRNGVDVKVWVSTNAKLSRAAKRLDQEEPRGEAKARARLDLIAIPGFGAANIGGIVTGGIKKISDKAWDKLKDDISSPPQCGSDASSNDLVKLSKLLAEHGFTVAENADFGDNPQPRSPLGHGLPLPVPQLGRDRRQRLRRRGEARHRRHRQRRAGARLPHDLAGGRALRPHPHRPRQLGLDGRRRGDRRRRRRARGDRCSRSS